MIDAGAPTRSRRLPFYAITITLVISALGGVFILLWFKLPTWAPAWVVEHSPWVDPIVRAVAENSDPYDRAVKRLVARGPAVVPKLTSLATHESIMVQRLVADVFGQIRDDRIIEPVIVAILGPDQPEKYIWVDVLSAQDPTLVTDRLLPHLVTRRPVEQAVLDVTGLLPDKRLIPLLVDIMMQSWDGGGEDYREGGFRETAEMAVESLVNSPCRSAVPEVIDAFTGGNAIIRRRIVDGIFSGDWAKPAAVRKLDERLQILLQMALDDSDSSIRRVTAWRMGYAPVAGAGERLLRMSRAMDPDERESAIFGLYPRLHGEIASRRIVEALQDEDDDVKLMAISILDRIEPLYPTSELLGLLSSSKESIRKSVLRTLNRSAYRTDSRVFTAFVKLMDDPVIEIFVGAHDAALLMAESAEMKAVVDEKYQGRLGRLNVINSIGSKE